MSHWWLGLRVFWWVVAALVLLVVVLKQVWAHVHVRSVLRWFVLMLFPRPHTPKPDLVLFDVTYSSTANSIKFDWHQQSIHLWGKTNGGIQDWIWERATSPRNVVIPAGTKEFVGLPPGKIFHFFPTIHAKTGAIDWRKEGILAGRDYPYPEPISVSTVSTGGGGGGCSAKTHLIW